MALEQTASIWKCPILLGLSDTSGGDPGMTRTCDLRFRKPSLYPAELRDRRPAGGGCLAVKYQSARLIARRRSGLCRRRKTYRGHRLSVRMGAWWACSDRAAAVANLA